MMSLALTTAMLLAGCSAESNIPGSSEADLPKVVMTDADIRLPGTYLAKKLFRYHSRVRKPDRSEYLFKCHSVFESEV